MGPEGQREILISGFYGFGNIGDEAVLAGMLQSLRARLGDVPCTVLSADPRATEAAHRVTAVGRTDPAAIVRAMRRARLFISGGGALLQDVTSGRSALYYLGLLRLAAALVPRTMVYASGIGPLRRPIIRYLARRVLDRTDAVTVRDADAAALVQALGIRKDPLLSADPAVLLRPAEAARAAALLDRSVAADVPLVGVAVRPWAGDAFVAPLSAALHRVARHRGAGIVVVPFYPAVDLPISRRLVEACEGNLVAAPITPAEAMALTSRMEVLVGLRLHALLFAAAVGTPPVGLAYDPKVASLFRDFDMDGPVALDADAEALTRAIEDAWDQREARRRALASRIARLQTRAEVAAEVAARLYAEG